MSASAGLRLIALVALSVVVGAPPSAQLARAAQKATKPPVVLPPPTPSVAPAPPSEVKPYDPQLLRLAEILGALTHLRPLCGEPDADAWRARMQALLDAEGTPPIRKERLAGAFNRGLEGYGLSYRTCTPNARIVIERFMTEGEHLAKDVGNRYRAS